MAPGPPGQPGPPVALAEVFNPPKTETEPAPIPLLPMGENFAKEVQPKPKTAPQIRVMVVGLSGLCGVTVPRPVGMGSGSRLGRAPILNQLLEGWIVKAMIPYLKAAT